MGTRYEQYYRETTMKISHESPLSLLKESREYNSYCYALVHLFETEPEYYKFFQESVQTGRHVLLDNSIFELGTSFESERYLHWINELSPTEFIIPDVLEDTLGTMDKALEWKEEYEPGVNAGIKTIGVVQGKSYNDIINCYDYLDTVIKVDKIAFSFDYSYYLEVCPHPNKWMSYTLGRIQTLTRLLNDGIINKTKPHHLLGCALPIEFMFYRKGFEWIESMDSSNPIVHGLLGIGYECGGLLDKQSIKLVDLIHTIPTLNQMNFINHNIKRFRSYVNGE